MSPAVALAEFTTRGLPPGVRPRPREVQGPRYGRPGCGPGRRRFWVRIGSSEKAEPWWALRTLWKSSGVKMRVVTRSARRFGM